MNAALFEGAEVQLGAMLAAREARMAAQHGLIKKHNLPVVSFTLISCRHQDCIVNRRSQLNRSDNDRSNKRKLRACVIRNSHIYKDCKFNNTYQNDRK